MKKNVFKMGVASVGLLGAMTLSAVAANNVHVYADEEKPVAVQPTAKQEAEKSLEAEKTNLDNLKTDQEEITEFLENAKVDLAKAEKDSQDAKDLASDVEEYMSQLSNLKTDIDEAEKMVTKAELGVTVEKAKENIAKLNDFKAQLEKQVAEGVKLLATEEGTPAEKKELSTALDELHKKEVEVDKKIAELEGVVSDAMTKIADLDALLQKDPAATDVDLTRANYKAARAQVEKDIEDLNARLAELKKEKESTPSSDELDLKIAAVEDEIRDKQAEIDDINKMLIEIGDFEKGEANVQEELPFGEVPAMEEEKDPEAESDAEMLPYTGVADGFVVFGAAATAILTGLGIAIPGKKKQ